MILHRFLIFTAALALLSLQGRSQRRFSFGFQISPKLSASNNTSINIGSRGITPDNEADGHSAFGGAVDFGVYAQYRIGAHDFIQAGAGTFNVTQKFAPSFTLFGRRYKDVYKRFTYLRFPVEYYRYLGGRKGLKIYGGIGIDFIQDILQHRPEYSSALLYKDGSRVENGRVEYGFNHANQETFNLLATCAVRADVALHRKLSLCGSLQLKQGFRPLLTSAAFFILDDPLTSQPYVSSHVTSINNGQCILFNVGITYHP